MIKIKENDYETEKYQRKYAKDHADNTIVVQNPTDALQGRFGDEITGKIIFNSLKRKGWYFGMLPNERRKTFIRLTNLEDI